MQHREMPQWVINSSDTSRLQMLARLEAAADFAKTLVDVARQALPLYQKQLDEIQKARAAREQFDAQEASQSSGKAKENAPAPEQAESASQQKLEARRPHVPRVPSPGFFVLAQRASELLSWLAPFIHTTVLRMLAKGQDPRAAMRRQAAQVVARTFSGELGIDLTDIAHADVEKLSAALKIIEGWLKEVCHDEGDERPPPARSRMRMPYVRMPSVNAAMPREGPTDPPAAPSNQTQTQAEPPKLSPETCERMAKILGQWLPRQDK